MNFLKYLLPIACLYLQAESTTQVIGSVLPRFPSLGNLIPFGNSNKKRPKPSYGPPKPSYGPPQGKGKPSYKPKPSNRPPQSQRKPSYKPSNGGRKRPRKPTQNNYKPQGGNGGGVSSLKPPSPTSSYQGVSGSQAGGGSTISDPEMKELLVSIHNMMKQIVANTGTEPLAVSSAPDSYGNPLAPPSTGNTQVSAAPDSYGNPLAPPSTGNTQVSAAPDSYGNPLASPVRGPRPGPGGGRDSSDSYGVAQAAAISNTEPLGSYSSGQDPVIRSTLEQISNTLRKYRETKTGIDERSFLDGKKPVRFPRNPSFSDILLMLEEKRQQKRNNVGVRKLQDDEFQERSGTDGKLPELNFDVFF